MDKTAALNLSNYNLQELANLKKSHEEDLQSFGNSLNSFRYLQRKLDDDKVIVNNLSKRSGDDLQVLIPMSNSLYLPGRLTDSNKYIVDIGTGYLAERNSQQTIDSLEHTLKVVKDNTEKVLGEISKRRDVVDQINIAIQKKYMEQMGKQQAQQGGADAFKKKAN